MASTITPPANLSQTAVALAALPSLRPATIRPGRALNTSRGVNYEAYLGNMVGDVKSPPCNSCSSSSGPMAECVVVSGFFGGSCGNCHYNSMGTRCSFREDAAAAMAGAGAGAGAAVRDLFDQAIQDAARPGGVSGFPLPGSGPSSSRPPPRPSRRLSLGQIATVPRIVDQVAPGTTYTTTRAWRTDLFRRKAKVYGGLAKMYEELAGLEEEEGELMEVEEEEEMDEEDEMEIDDEEEGVVEFEEVEFEEWEEGEEEELERRLVAAGY